MKSSSVNLGIELRVFPILILFLASPAEEYNRSLSVLMDAYSCLSQEKQRMIDRWFMTLPKSEFVFLIETVKQVIAQRFLIIKQNGSSDRSALKPFLLLLKILHSVNAKLSLVPSKEFYVDILVEEVDVEDEITIWNKNKKHKTNTFTFIDYPWALDCGFKSKVLEFEIHQEREAFLMNTYFAGFNLEFVIEGAESLFFHKLHVRREHLIEDTLNQLLNPLINFRKNIKVMIT